jgi:hypothetical protein
MVFLFMPDAVPCPRVVYNLYLLLIPENDPSPRQIIRTHFHPYFIPRKYADIVHPHFSGDGCQDFMPVFQLHFEHSIAQGFDNDTILFNELLFRHTFWVRKDSEMP